MAKGYRVYIDQNDCTGCGLCEQDCPELFFMWDRGKGSDGLAYVKNVSDKTGMNDEGPKLRGVNGLAVIPDRLLDAVIETTEACPGECLGIVEAEDC